MMHDFGNPRVPRVGSLSSHAYMIPFADKAGTEKGERDNSPYFHSLCDGWSFTYYIDVPEDIADAIATDGDVIPVPSSWQRCTATALRNTSIVPTHSPESAIRARKHALRCISANLYPPSELSERRTHMVLEGLNSFYVSLRKRQAPGGKKT